MTASAEPAAPPVPSVVANTMLATVMFAGRAACSLVTTILVARALGPAGRGHVSLVVGASGILALLGSAGTGSAMLRSTRLGLSRPPDLYGDGLRVGAAFASLVTGMLVIAMLMNGARGTDLVIVTVAVVPQLALANLSHAATLDDRVATVMWTSLVGVGGYSLATVVQWISGTMTATSNLLVWIAATCTSVITLAWATRGRFVPRRPGSFPWLFRQSCTLTVASAAVLALLRIDVVLVRARRGLVELGQYSIAVGCAEVVLTLAMAVSAGTLPSLAGQADADELVCRATRTTLAGLVVLGGAVAIASPWALPLLFGHEYAGAHEALIWLLPGVVCFVLHVPLFNYLAGHGRGRQLTILTCGALSLNVAGNLVLLDHFDYRSAAAVSTVSYAALFAACVILFARTTGRSLRHIVVIEWRDVTDTRRAVRSLVRSAADTG